MIKRTLLFCLFLGLGTSIMALPGPDQGKSNGMEIGSITLKSLHRMAFGEQDILFLGDSEAAVIYAVALDTTPATGKDPFEVKAIDEKLASMLGTTPSEIYIRDLAVHQASRQAFLAVRRGSDSKSSYHLFRVRGSGEVQPVKLEGVPYASYAMNNTPAEDAVNRRGRKMRQYGITSMTYANGTLYVAGLSNDAFTSTVRKIPFPFDGTETNGTLEIYHVAHARYETDAPVTSFVPWDWKGEAYMVAGFTCTPLVTFPRKAFNNGEQVKGKTVAELGAGNSPVDIRPFEYDGKPYFIIANNRRALMYVEAEDVATQKGLDKPLEKTWTTKGVPFVALPGTPVQQLDILDDDNMLILQRDGRGALNLRSLSEKRIIGIWD